MLRYSSGLRIQISHFLFPVNKPVVTYKCLVKIIVVLSIVDTVVYGSLNFGKESGNHESPWVFKVPLIPSPLDGHDYSCDKSSPTILKTVVFGEVALPPPVRPCSSRNNVDTEQLCRQLRDTGDDR